MVEVAGVVAAARDTGPAWKVPDAPSRKARAEAKAAAGAAMGTMARAMSIMVARAATDREVRHETDRSA